MVAAYPGLAHHINLDYATWVALWCNLAREQLRRAWEVRTGVSMAFSQEALSPAVYRAVAYTPEEAEVLEFEARKAARKLKAKRAKHGLYSR